MPGYVTYDRRDLQHDKIRYPEQKVLCYNCDNYAVTGDNGQIDDKHMGEERANFIYFNGAFGTHDRACAGAYPSAGAQTHFFADNGYPTQCSCLNRGW